MNTRVNTPPNPGNTAGNGNPTNKELLLKEINAVTAETAELVRHAADVAGEQGSLLREDLENRYRALQDRFHALQTRMTQQARDAARATDQYVHAHPWQSVGVAVTGGLVAGLVIGAWMRRS